MKKSPDNTYYISTSIPELGNALTKARRDVETLAERRGMRAVRFAAENTAGGRTVKRVKLALCGLVNCARLAAVPRGGVILVQYPLQPMKSAYLFNTALKLLKRTRKHRYIALVHDLDSARDLASKTGRFSDTVFLRRFDAVICHNERMKEYLAGLGYAPDRLICLGIFDYLYDAEPALPARGFAPSVNVAANLAPEKSGYVYRLLENGAPGFTLHLYGPNFVPPAVMPQNAVYHGVEPPERLVSVMEGAFGLVWDGESADGCAGGFGRYLRLNDPHKASLYLSCNMPVIIWSEAALAEHILAAGAGAAVPSLAELGELFANMDEVRYNSIIKAAGAEGALIRGGRHFDAAMDAALAMTAGAAPQGTAKDI